MHQGEVELESLGWELGAGQSTGCAAGHLQGLLPGLCCPSTFFPVTLKSIDLLLLFRISILVLRV